MALTQKTAHVVEALANLAAQYKGKANIEAMLTAYINQVQDLEGVLFELLTERFIDDAEGVQVDGFGSIVGEAREGRSDADYKLAIQARIVLNLSNGTPEDLIALVRSVVGAAVVRMTDYFPAGFVAYIEDPIDPLIISPAKAYAILQKGKPAGVQAQLSFYVANPFRYDAGPGYDQGKYGGAL